MLWVVLLGVFGLSSAITVDDATMDRILQNSNAQELMSVFNEFEEEQHRDPAERAMRFREFRRHLTDISNHNHGDYSWKEGINSFADETDSERASHLGLNVSMHRVTRRRREADELTTDIPEAKNWINAGAVSEVKDQGSCGSCWAFGSVGTIEGVYWNHAQKRRHFAEQQVLDCTYDYDGCGGGFMEDGVLAVRDINGNRLSSTRDYPYVARDGDCPGSNVENAMVAARITNYITIEYGERHTIAALAQRALTVTIYVNDAFFAYTDGIFRDDYQASWPNHALTAVAYTPEYILVKNSWGTNWGDQGFIKVARDYTGCAFHQMVGYAVMEPTGQADTAEDDASAVYDDDYTPEPSCRDDFTGCADRWCEIYTLVRAVCPRTCGDCEGDDTDGECPSGTIMCDDGVCRHEHMCH